MSTAGSPPPPPRGFAAPGLCRPSPSPPPRPPPPGIAGREHLPDLLLALDPRCRRAAGRGTRAFAVAQQMIAAVLVPGPAAEQQRGDRAGHADGAHHQDDGAERALHTPILPHRSLMWTTVWLR